MSNDELIEQQGEKNPKLISNRDGEVCKLNLNKEDLDDPDVFNWFIKAVEKLVRKDERYDNYVEFLKGLGYTKDVLQGGIDSNVFQSTSVEMHHGPCFTLYDICAIVTDHLLASGEKVNTFKVAKIVLREHELGRIQLVMGLTKTNHELAHSGKVFIHINQTIGNVMGFIRDFNKGFRREHLYTLEEYLRLCKEYKATDNDYLVLRSVISDVSDNMKK